MRRAVTAREWLAIGIIAVGGTMWLWLPGPAIREGGPLKDESIGGARWHVPPGRSRAEWVLLTNAGRAPVTLSSAKVGLQLRGQARVIGAMARHGLKTIYGTSWPPRVTGVFSPVDGFVIAPGKSASITFGLSAPFPVRLTLGGVEIRYRASGTDYVRTVDAQATLCVTRGHRCHT